MDKEKKSSDKTIKKAWRVLLYFVLFVILLPIVLSLLLILPPVQTKVVHWTTGYISKTLNAEVSIGYIAFKPFKTLAIQQFLVRDLQSDTLLYAANLDVGISSIELEQNAFHLSAVKLDSAYFNLYRIENSDSMNLDFILDALSTEDTSSSDVSFKLYCDDLEINHLRFRFDDHKAAFQTKDQIDFSHLYLSDFNAKIQDVFLDGPTIYAQIENIDLKEKSGFELQHLSAKTMIADTAIICENLALESGNTSVYGKYSMHGDSWSSYADYITDIRMEAKLDSSSVDFHDVAFFSKNIDHMLSPITVVGTASGTVANLRAKLDYLSFGKTGNLSGKIKIKGLPDIDATFFDADFDQLYASVSDIEMLNIPTDESMTKLDLPDQVKRFGYLDFQGSFVGFLTDFVAYGSCKTALGGIKADINVKSPNDTLKYSGNVASNGFQLGQLIEAEPSVKAVAFDLNIDGKGTDIETMAINGKGSLKSIELLGYEYKNVKIDGVLDRQIFEGNVAINDSNVVLDFNGLVNFKTEIPQISCVSKVSKLHLDQLNLVPSDTNSELSAEFALDMKGKSLEGLFGNLAVTNLSYSNPRRSIKVDTITLVDQLIENGHDIELESSIGHVHISGSTSLFDLPYAFIKVAKPYLPRLFDQNMLAGKDTTQEFDYNIKLINDPSIVGLISDEIYWQDTLEITGSVNTENKGFVLNLTPLNWNYGNYIFDSNHISVFPKSDSLMIDFSCSKFKANEGLFLENFNINSILSNDSLSSKLTWFNKTSQADSGLIDLLVYRSDSVLLNAKLNKLAIRVAGVQWKSIERASLHVDTNYIQIKDLNLRSSSGYVTSNGSWSESVNEHLVFDVSNFDLAYISNFGITKMKFQGIFNGAIDMYQRDKSFVADADVRIDSLFVDGFEIGTIQGRSEYKINQKALGLNLNLSYRGDRNVHVTGDFFPFAEKNQLALNAQFKDFRASVLEPFINDFTSELDGNMSGNIRITGMASEPKLNGQLSLSDFALKVNYLNTKYRIQKGAISVKPNFIGMDAVSLTDENNSNAFLTATVLHNNFRDFNYDLFIEANDFMCLNTSLADNEDYYGTAIVSGEINISGFIGQTDIDADVKTEKGTAFNIPLTDAASIGQADFIRFVEPKNKKKSQRQETIAEDIAGLSLNFQLEVDNDAQVQIIFDQQVGDIIKVLGNGDILMNIDNKGTFSIYGDYVIAGGYYLFTLQNIINKRFSVQPGSRLTWSGSPYDAKIDLSAIYKLRASPKSLVAGIVNESDSAKYDQRMPVDVYLNMTNTLSSPDIGFDINLPSLQSSDIANQLLDPATSNEQEINRQTFSLLVTNSFATRVNSSLAASSPLNSGYEVLSNQFSNLISQYFDNLDVGVNYRPSDGVNANQTEVAISTELFNDRVLLEVNGSVLGESQTPSQSNNVAGEFNLEYKFTKEGNLRGRVYNEANNYNPTNLNQSPYTQGVGVFYRKEFDTFGEFFRGIFKRKKATPKREDE
ncbi:MAG: translocation/assembly module TamB [Salibacteraceae bacterium]|nr:translocation/assembly module TamB [Salibacteraceae bacterium]